MAHWAGKARPWLNGFGEFSNYLFRAATWLPPLIWINTCVAEVTFIKGPSMYPFLNPHYNESTRRDLCLVDKWHGHRGLQRGMVVTFRHPMDPEKVAVKRVIGLEGDVIRTKPPFPFEYTTVPEGHIWVEGDGDRTIDSNTYGAISARLVTGRITHILSPWSRAGPLRWQDYKERSGIQRAHWW